MKVQFLFFPFLATKVSILLIGLISFNSFGCVCKPKEDFKTKEDLEEYEFIARIKITSIDSADVDKNDKSLHQISIETLEQFKGEKQNIILVSGPHRSLTDKLSSCSMGERLGEEWIIFAMRSKVYNSLITGRCMRSRRIKRSDGFEHLEYPSKESYTDKVRKVFNMSRSIDPNLNGLKISYYENRKIQLKENYQNGLLHGDRTIWYPNGQIQSFQKYIKGKEEGMYKWFSEKGELIQLEYFRNGIQVDTSTYWYETDTLKYQLLRYMEWNSCTYEVAKKILSTRKIWFQTVFNEKGEMISFLSNYRNGLKKKEWIFLEDNLKVDRDYHENGVLKHEYYHKDGKYFGKSKMWD